jgi:hypothetical protein
MINHSEAAVLKFPQNFTPADLSAPDPRVIANNTLQPE